MTLVRHIPKTTQTEQELIINEIQMEIKVLLNSGMDVNIFVNEERLFYWLVNLLYRQILYEIENAEEKQHILFGAVQIFRTLILLCMFGFSRNQNGRCYYFCYTLVFLCDIQGSRMFALKVAALICMPMLCYMHVIKVRLLNISEMHLCIVSNDQCAQG